MLATRTSTSAETSETSETSESVPPPEAETEEREAADPPESPSGGGERRPLLRRGTTWLTLLVVVLAVAATLLAVAWRQSASEADRLSHQQELSASALAAARMYAVDLTTYDHAKLADQQAKLAGESTQRFQDTFADSMQTLGPIFERLEATAVGTVVNAAVVEVTGKRATVIAFLDQEASSKELDKPETQASRVSMTLVREGGRWLLDRVDLV